MKSIQDLLASASGPEHDLLPQPVIRYGSGILSCSIYVGSALPAREVAVILVGAQLAQAPATIYFPKWLIMEEPHDKLSSSDDLSPSQIQLTLLLLSELPPKEPRSLHIPTRFDQENVFIGGGPDVTTSYSVTKPAMIIILLPTKE